VDLSTYFFAPAHASWHAVRDRRRPTLNFLMNPAVAADRYSMIAPGDRVLRHTDLDSSRKGPLVIKERVRQLGGALTVESEPGRGARLEIAVPVSHHGSYR